MLELNGKEEKVNKAYLANLGIEKFPVTFKLVNRLKKFDNVNKRWQIPRSFNLENTFSTYTDEGSLLFRYYKTKRPKEIGNKVVEDYYCWPRCPVSCPSSCSCSWPSAWAICSYTDVLRY